MTSVSQALKAEKSTTMSSSFLISFGVLIGSWIIVNAVVLVVHPPDPYPFILLNLLLSCLAAIQEIQLDLLAELGNKG